MNNRLDQPLISIIVASYNAADLILGCVQSIAAQTYPHTELIVIDGGSTDRTPEILEQNEASISWWISEPDRGIYHAWNKGIERASGDWICFLGTDDRFANPDSLSTMVQRLLITPVDLVSAKGAWVDSQGHLIEVWGDPWNWSRLKRYQTLVHPGMLHRAELFERHGRFSEQYRCAGDYEFLLRLGAGTTAAFVDEVTVLIGKAGVSHTMIKVSFWERKKIQQNHNEIGPIAPWATLVIGFLKVGYCRIRGLT